MLDEAERYRRGEQASRINIAKNGHPWSAKLILYNKLTQIIKRPPCYEEAVYVTRSSSASGPIGSTSHCYCTMCQKQHGAAAGTYANIERADLVIESGQAYIVEFASSEHGRRAFCRLCGSTMFWRSEQSPDRIAVALGTLDSPVTRPVDIELHTDTKPFWLPMRDPA